MHFAAKDVLFKSRPLRVILHAMGAVPIARRMDHGAEPRWTTRTRSKGSFRAGRGARDGDLS